MDQSVLVASRMGMEQLKRSIFMEGAVDLPINWRQCYFLMMRNKSINQSDIRGLGALW